METFEFASFTLLSFLLFFTCNLAATSPQLIFNPVQDNICKWVSCGQGTCQATDTFPGFQCNCAPGWTKFKMGDSEFPYCVLPNCSVNLQCGNGPPAALLPPPLNLNLSDPCVFTWCLDGSCERNGTEFRCQCQGGSANLMNDPKLPCFKKCSFGADCHRLDLGFGSPIVQSPIPPSSPPLQGSSSSPKTGSGEMLNSSSQFRLLTIILLATVFLTWI